MLQLIVTSPSSSHDFNPSMNGPCTSVTVKGTSCLCIYFAYYWGSFLVVGFGGDVNCDFNFVAVVVVV